MKYTSPVYLNEIVRTNDVICESPYQVVYVNKVIGTDENGEDIVATVTQVTVDIGGLF